MTHQTVCGKLQTVQHIINHCAVVGTPMKQHCIGLNSCKASHDLLTHMQEHLRLPWRYDADIGTGTANSLHALA